MQRRKFSREVEVEAVRLVWDRGVHLRRCGSVITSG